jgi:hypothetical protein
MTVPTTLAGNPDDTPGGGPYCPDCGQELEWIQCDAIGCEDGYIMGETLMEEDPLWYSPDDMEPCTQCDGKGGWLWCSNQDCPAKKEGGHDA